MNGKGNELTRRKRLLFRCTHRGVRELDIILGQFARAFLPQMDSQQLDDFESLLEADDNDLYEWISGRTVPPPVMDTHVIKLLINFKIDVINNC
ncbi:MAG TPA: succinate dehydrogenase assembly factor 2 [Alphaproteobacteria bacterium]|jgi:antitoxin CptB|nr:succinate dehydrogenase assembly factor 2 [Alphaproteobacteria bacterium]HJO88236.1 succinate dehydrogenase assembly factor 2 [Alphaproteobacteria bacterium]|tara:strand:- start:4233 stop:4514 length:282 start_codon:yes stop_codon:yes gene_type:complete